jgi:hypothetical protein
MELEIGTPICTTLPSTFFSHEYLEWQMVSPCLGARTLHPPRHFTFCKQQTVHGHAVSSRIAHNKKFCEELTTYFPFKIYWVLDTTRTAQKTNIACCDRQQSDLISWHGLHRKWGKNMMGHIHIHTHTHTHTARWYQAVFLFLNNTLKIHKHIFNCKKEKGEKKRLESPYSATHNAKDHRKFQALS